MAVSSATCITLKDLMMKYRLTDRMCEREVTDETMDEIASSCCGKFREMPPYLPGMKEIHVHDAERDGHTEAEKRNAFFKTWKRGRGTDATYRVLIAALLKIKCTNDAEEVCKLASDSGVASASAASSKVSTGKWVYYV